jgi:hypothetical protein
MTSYAVGILRDVRLGPPIVEYLERIDATLAPYDGHFIVYGGEAEVLEERIPAPLSSSSSRTDLVPRIGTARPPTSRSCRSGPRTP